MKKVLLVFLMLAWVSFASAQSITGTITASDDRSGLPGVSVRVKGTNRGTQSNATGGYSIDAAKGDVLQFSFIGYQLQELSVGNSSVLDVSLASDERLLQEVVVTGLGRQKEEKAVGTAMQTVKADKLTFAKETNVASALTGKIAGVKLQGAPSTSFREPNLLIRGASGLSIY